MQGDEPELPPELLAAVAASLAADPDCPMATAAHAIDRLQDWFNPNVVKVVTDSRGRALYFSRAPVPFHRDGLKGFPAIPPDASHSSHSAAAVCSSEMPAASKSAAARISGNADT